MPIKILNPVGHNKIGQLRPKPGRNPVGTYWAWGGKPKSGGTGALGAKKGPPNQVVQATFGQDPSRAGVGTVAGRNLTQTTGGSPIRTNFDIATTPLKPALLKHGQGGQQFLPGNVPLLMPHERPVIGANNTQNMSKRALYRTSAGGASKTMVSDTPFHRPIVKVKAKPQPSGVKEAVHISKSSMPSFRTNGNLWYDPNNSFVKGRQQAGGTGNGPGVGRWQTVKRGAAG